MSEASIAGLLAIVIGLMKLLDVVVSALITKFKKQEEHILVVKLDPEVSRMIRETHESARDTLSIIAVKDHDGAPMVYSLRSTNEDIKDVANCIKEVSSVQERIVENLDRLEDKIEENNREITRVVNR